MKAGEGKVKKTFEELVLKEYQCYAKVFSETESHRLPKHQPWDHTIDLKPDALETLKMKVYPVTETRLDAAEGSNRGSRQRGVKRLDALTHTAIAYAATSP
jgi:hypothetical protein